MIEATRFGNHLSLVHDGARPIDGKFWVALTTALETIPDDCTSLSLHGGPSFGVGVSLVWMSTKLRRGRARGANVIVEMGDVGRRAIERLTDLPIPTFAFVCGEITGGHAELAMATDVRVGLGPGSVYLPEPEFGIVPDFVPMRRIVSVLGRRDAMTGLLGGMRLAVGPGSGSSFCDVHVTSFDEAVDTARSWAERAATGPVVPALRRGLLDESWTTVEAAAMNARIHSSASLETAIARVSDRRSTET